MQDEDSIKEPLINRSAGLHLPIDELEALEAERQRAEEALQESEERYQRLLEQSPIGIGLASLDGKVLSANKAMQDIIGYSLAELKEINLADAYDNPEDRKPLLEKLNRHGSVFNYPVRLKRKDGTQYDALLSMSRINLDGGDVLQTICIDITERKRVTSKSRQSTLSFVLRPPLTPLHERFVKTGLPGFKDREAIELLLSMCPGTCPRRVRERVEEQCINVFHNVRELLSASPQKLFEAGLKPQCLFYLKFLREMPAEFLRGKIIERPFFKSSQEIFDYLYYDMRDLKKEVLKVIYLDSRDRIIDIVDLFEGEIGRAHFRPRKVIETAIEHSAGALIFVHNHPSGDPTPSKLDKRQTRDFVFVGNILQIRVLDHIIIGDNRYFSFADEGLIQQYEDDFLKTEIKRI